MTVDVDIKADPEPEGYFESIARLKDPEPEGYFESIARLKDSFPINIELASPDMFIPALPDWKQRSPFIARHGNIDFYHYDLYSQAIAKLERGHARDIEDVEAMYREGLIDTALLHSLFTQIEPRLIEHPAIEASSLAHTIQTWCQQHA